MALKQIKMNNDSQPSWFQRNKVLGIILCVASFIFLLGIVGAIISEPEVEPIHNTSSGEQLPVPQPSNDQQSNQSISTPVRLETEPSQQNKNSDKSSATTPNPTPQIPQVKQSSEDEDLTASQTDIQLKSEPASPSNNDNELPTANPPPQFDQNNYLKIAGVQLSIATENTTDYDRSQYGNHNSNACDQATNDPYTGLAITSCDVDHVVALAEAHKSGAWQWDRERKRSFAQDGDNHLATLACVNRSKGARDIADWSDNWISKSAACGGGYRVSTQGRCLFAKITVRVKAKYDLSVDSAEAEALRNLVNCFSD